VLRKQRHSRAAERRQRDDARHRPRDDSPQLREIGGESRIVAAHCERAMDLITTATGFDGFERVDIVVKRLWKTSN
jgi:hypothetical protein